MKPVDVLIHIRQRLDAGSSHIVDDCLRKIPGVVAPWFTPRMESLSLVVVYYNPNVITATAVLAGLRRLGFDASLIAI
ncbi:MAG: hypothetical protein ACC641_08675 [Acidiferrobacterales bacterium]